MQTDCWFWFSLHQLNAHPRFTVVFPWFLSLSVLHSFAFSSKGAILLLQSFHSYKGCSSICHFHYLGTANDSYQEIQKCYPLPTLLAPNLEVEDSLNLLVRRSRLCCGCCWIYLCAMADILHMCHKLNLPFCWELLYRVADRIAVSEAHREPI